MKPHVSRSRFQKSIFIAVWSLAWLCVLTSPSPAAKPERSKEELRKLATLPPWSFSFRVDISSDGILVWKRSPLEIAEEIASIRKELHGTSQDAWRLLQLGDLLKTTSRTNETWLTYTNAIKAFREEVEAHPTDALLLCGLGRALSRNWENQEAEAVLRHATTMAPKEPECWATFGAFLCNLALSDLWVDPDPTLKTNASTASKRWMLQLVLPPTDRLERAQFRYKEATECFDAAIAIAPTNASIYERRANLSRVGAVIRAVKEEAGDVGLSDAALKKAALAWIRAFAAPADCLPDLRRAAELDRHNPHRLGVIGVFEISCDTARTAGRGVASKASVQEHLSEETLKSIRWKIDQLKELTESPVKKTASDAAEFLGLLQVLVMKDTVGAETSFRQATSLNPKNERAWDGLFATIGKEEDYEKILRASEERIRVYPTARAYLVLARTHSGLQRWDRAVEDTQAAMKAAPGQAIPELAYLGAVLRSGNTNLINRALKLTTGLNKGGWRELEDDERIHLMFITGLYFAYFDRVERARDVLRTALKMDPKHEGATKALEIIQDWP